MLRVQMVHHQVVFAAKLTAILAKTGVKGFIVHVSHMLAIQIIQHEFLCGFSCLVALVTYPGTFFGV